MNIPPPDPAPRKRIPIQSQDLYESHKIIHVRAIDGWFARWRWILVWVTQIVFYGLCWLPWNGRQAVLFHLAERKFYIFNLVLWPQDVFFLAILLIISAYAMFLFTAIGGRLWCGYACPQTVYTEIFMWIERKIEGDHTARRKLEQAPPSATKLMRRSAKYGAWGLLALWTGFTFVGYFTPVHSLVDAVVDFSLSPWETFWILFYAGFTYLMAGHLREQVCKYMCPYARFQGVMFDPDTLVVTYDKERGEPRGARKHKGEGDDSAQLGDCIDCKICVQVCPTGIDIRNGLQYECIGCAACIDACDQVMEKTGRPKGLIRYSTERAIEQHWGWPEIVRHIARPRVIVYTTILFGICMAFVWGLANKAVLRVDVIRDRGALAREVEGGMIENVYRLHIMNVSEQTQHYRVDASGLQGLTLIADETPGGKIPSSIELPAASSRTLTVQARLPDNVGKPGSNVMYFDVSSIEDPSIVVHEKTTFIRP
ncbi:MAG TPA: cytochrome c oxidase accessory protein CcoG [Rhodocyclaceae bacterium]|nr:cytochrome c oxidase accessory protein CcoG [Rhodocyclaceae bacterium]